MALPSSSSPPSSVLPHLIYKDNDPNLPQLTYNNVNYWKLAMYNHIEGNNLISHIDGTTKPPPRYKENGNFIENPKYKEWLQPEMEVCRLIKSTIHVDLTKELFCSLAVDNMTSAELWNFLIQNVHQIPAMTHPDHDSNQGVKWPNFTRYLPLYEAAAKGNMKGLDDILKKDPTAHKVIITGASETALMVASRKKENHNLVKKLVSLMSKEDLEMQNSFGRTAMFGAAAAGDVESLILMVNISPELPNIRDIDYQLPLHFAAYTGQKDSVKYLLTVTDIKSLNDFTSLTLVNALISGKFYDDCLDLFGRFPKLAVLDVSVLERLAYNHSSFLSGTHFGFWRRKIYYYLPCDQLERPVDYYERMADIENPTKEVDDGKLTRNTNWLSSMFWQLTCKYVPKIKRVQEKKVIHTQALQLLRLICSEIAKLDRKAVRDFIGQPLANAAAIGNAEVVEEILAAFPNAMFLLDKNKRGVFHIAIANRQANVFNLIYQITSQRQLFLAKQDSSQNTASHLAAYLVEKMDVRATLDLKSSGPGATLHMQRELQWFKAVQKLSRREDREARNIDGKTPPTIFAESHEDLTKEGEQWMKDRANSGLIVATLNATIVFASAITVPGGSDSATGLPLLAHRQAFLCFAISDAAALFTSAYSMLMFVGILTARYAFTDFLERLPRRLMMALITLFLSIMFMMIAFASILYLVFGNERRWVLILLSSAAPVPVVLFAILQFKPLVDIVSSTYGRGMFYKRSNRLLF